MSNKINSTNKIGGFEELAKAEGLTLEQFKDFVKQKFYTQYGRWENASGKMFVELEHNGDADDHNTGSVKWRKGIRLDSGESDITEDVVLERTEAIPRYSSLVHKGYSRIFPAITAEDFEKENQKRRSLESALQREGLLGLYYKGDKEFFRLSEFERGLYSAERGYDGCITSGKHELTVSSARCELDFALAEGFRREGEELPDLCMNPLEAFGVEIQGNIAIDEARATPKEGEFNMGGFAEMFGEE